MVAAVSKRFHSDTDCPICGDRTDELASYPERQSKTKSGKKFLVVFYIQT